MVSLIGKELEFASLISSTHSMKFIVFATCLCLVGVVAAFLYESPFEKVLHLPVTNSVTCKLTVAGPWEKRKAGVLRVGEHLTLMQNFQSNLPTKVVVASGPLWISNVVDLQYQSGRNWVAVPYSSTAFDGVKVFRTRGGSQARTSIEPHGTAQYGLGFSGSFVIDKPGRYRVRTFTVVYLGPEISDTHQVVSPFQEFELHPETEPL